MPQPAELDAAVELLVGQYREAQVALEERLAAIIEDPKEWRQRRRLRELIRANDAVVRGLEAATREWLAVTLPEVYGLGAAFAAELVGSSFQWNAAHLEAVQNLAERSFTDVAENLRLLRSSTRKALQGWAQDATRSALLESRTAVQGGRAMAQVAARAGIFSVEYSNGARHAIADYAEMVVRTTTATSYNLGSIEQTRQEGIEWIQYSDGPDCGVTSHRDPRKADLLVVPIDEVVYLSHPRCRRSCLPAPDGAPIPGVDPTAGPARAPEPPPVLPSPARAARTSRVARARARAAAG